MKAIDFACHLLMRVERDSMPSCCRLVLLMVAAGLDNAQDIAAMSGLRVSSCTALLRKLSREHYLQSVAGSVYLLAPKGREYVRHLLTFFSSPPPCGRSDT